MEVKPGEQLIRIHRFRFVKASGCGLGGIELVVEEALGPVAPGTSRCTARPDHRELVPRSEFTVQGDGVEDTLEKCLANIRPRRFFELFLPSG